MYSRALDLECEIARTRARTHTTSHGAGSGVEESGLVDLRVLPLALETSEIFLLLPCIIKHRIDEVIPTP